LKKRQQLFDEVAKAVFEESQLSGPIRDSLRELGGLVATRAIDPSISCGIAFVGYGEQDIFPNLIAFWADGVIDGRLRYWRTVNERVDRDTPAHVITFGDDEMIETFLYGVNPHYLLSLVEIPDSVKLFGVPTRRDTIITSLPEVEEKLDALVNKFSTHRAGIIKIVSFLRQADLAKTAEEMVKLECLRQRFSEEHEFTGGPVDVALITKSGFTWVKHETRVESGSN